MNALYKINYEAPILITSSLIRKKRILDDSSIIFISSIMSIVSTEMNGVYTGTKGALASLTKCLALELAPMKIRVNSVSPAFVKTPMLDRLGLQIDLDIYERLHPLGFGEPEDVANPIIYLLADVSKWITGTNLILDGGYSAK